MARKDDDYTDLREWRHDVGVRSLLPVRVYNDMPAVLVSTDSASGGAKEVADSLFDEHITRASEYKHRKEPAKREHLADVVQALFRASHSDGCVRYPRRLDETSRVNLQVIDCAVEAGLIHEFRSPPGSPKQSRAFALWKLKQHLPKDPWAFDPDTITRYVQLRDRKTREEIPIDKELSEPEHIAAQTQFELEVVNRVNSGFEITYRPWDEWEERYGARKRLRPVHVARFTDRWDWHGRLYTGRYGHQSLSPRARGTIEFHGIGFEHMRAVEPDFQGMHPRLLYHLNGLAYTDDPYQCWGRKTTKQQRYLAKTVLNAAINAKGGDNAKAQKNSTVKACNLKANPSHQTASGKWKEKRGKARAKAEKVRKALDITGLKFGDVYDVVNEFHHLIAGEFGRDWGIRLMRLDSAIALVTMFFLTKRGVPCLSCHDSLIAPRSEKTRLMLVMKHAYRLASNGFDPVIRCDD
jgi:hypothetical protein